MKNLFLITFLLVFYSTSIKGETTYPERSIPESIAFSPEIVLTPSLVNMSSLPSTLVANTVNVISGDVFDHTIHHETMGPTPYRLGSLYNSGNPQKNSLGIAWGYTHNYLIETRQEYGIQYTKGGFFNGIGSLFKKMLPLVTFPSTKIIAPTGKATGKVMRGGLKVLHYPFRHLGSSSSDLKIPESAVILELHEANGGTLQFIGDTDGSHMRLQLHNTGFTNVVANGLSGKNNIKNIKVRYLKEQQEWHVSYPDGTYKIYVKAKEPDGKSLLDPLNGKKEAFFRRSFVLHREKTPSGNTIHYEYNGTRIKKIYTKSSDNTYTINWVAFSYSKEKKASDDYFQQVTTSDGYNCTFFHKKIVHPTLKKEDGYIVRKITSPMVPPLYFSYAKNNALEKHLMIKKREPDGNYLEIAYHNSNKSFNDFDLTLNAYENMSSGAITKKTKEQFEKRFLKQRVSSLYGPLGKDEKKIKLYSFSYSKRRLTNAKLIYRCIVKDALDNITCYYFNQYQRLTRVEHRTKENQLLSIQKYVWANAPGNHEGRLVAQIMLNEKNKPLFAKRYHYDHNGNSIQEDLWGDITGEKNSFSLDIKGLPQGSKEVAITKYTYSKDGMNLLTSIIDPLGNHTYYQYKPKTNLITAIIRCNGTKPSERHFFSYDSCGLITEETTDDGNTKERNNMSGVTQKTSIEYTYRYESPYFGQIETIRECYFDIIANKKIPLNKTVHTFNKMGNIIKKEIYDSERTLQATMEFTYDELGRITYTKDAEGNEIYTKYDKNGRIQQKKGPKKDTSIEYSYDRIGRLKKKTLLQDDLSLSSSVVYDPLGRIIEAIDPQGNSTKYTYDALGRIIAISYPKIFSESGEAIVPIKKYTYEQCGLKVTELDENGRTSTISYTVLGKPLSEIAHDKTRKEFLYDIMGNLIEEYNSLGVTTTYSYDFLKRVIETKIRTKDKEIFTKKSTYTGPQLTEEHYSNRKRESHRYDGAGRKIRTHLHAQSEKEQDRRIKFTYDTLGRVLEEQHFISLKEFIGTRYTYDKLSRIIKKEVIDDKGTIFSRLLYTYDEDGNRKECTRSIMGKNATIQTEYYPNGSVKSSIDPDGRITKIDIDYAYKNQHDQMVVKKTTTYPDGIFEEEIFDTHFRSSKKIIKTAHDIVSEKKLFYDPAGNITTIKTAVLNTKKNLQNIVIRIRYGPCNRRETVIEEFLEHGKVSTTQYTYNEYGQLRKIERPDSTIRYSYDAKGRVNRIFGMNFDYTYGYDLEDRIVESYNMLTGKETKRKYNTIGDLIEEILENDTKIAYTYDGIGRVTQIACKEKSISYNYSPYALSEICYNDGKKQALYTVFDRDLSGNILKDSHGIEYTYDLLARASSIQHDLFSETATEYDAFGRVTAKKIHDSIDDYELQYTYDPLGQVQQEYGHFNLKYRFNSVGQREEVNQIEYQHTKKHEIASVGPTTYSYSENGCRTAMQKYNQETTYRYDGLDRLIEVATEDKQAIYTYDGFDRRISKKIIQPRLSSLLK